LRKENVLKIDKDCHVSSDWLQDYTGLAKYVCNVHNVRVLSIKKTNSRKKGIHLYISIWPPVEAMLADRLQWLLGDDCLRVDFNRARIRAGLREWNKLFEVAGKRLRTISSPQGSCRNKNNREMEVN
jgi:hypothetical protein